MSKSKKSNDSVGPAEDPDGEGLADIATPVDSARGEIDEETGKVKGEDGALPEDRRDIFVAGTQIGEPVEPSKDAVVPLPEKPKLAVGEVSTRMLNSLPDGAEFPKEPVAKVNLRESIRKGQEQKQKDAGNKE